MGSGETVATPVTNKPAEAYWYRRIRQCIKTLNFVSLVRSNQTLKSVTSEKSNSAYSSHLIAQLIVLNLCLQLRRDRSNLTCVRYVLQYPVFPCCTPFWIIFLLNVDSRISSVKMAEMKSLLNVLLTPHAGGWDVPLFVWFFNHIYLSCDFCSQQGGAGEFVYKELQKGKRAFIC